MFLRLLLVGIGGFTGAVLRYLVGLIPAFRTLRFPLSTLLINFAGCVLIAFLAELSPQIPKLDDRAMLLLKAGLCGGFTTFSTFSLETVELLDGGRFAVGLIYVLLSIAACIGAIYLGRLMARSLLS